jgi:DivIVA domain-containing protein
MPDAARAQRTEVVVLAFEIFVGLAILVGIGLVLSTRAPVWDDEPADTPDNGLPDDRLLRSDDIPRLRFRVGWRGYRMSDVDAALEAARLALEAAEHGGAGSRHADALSEQPPSVADRPLSQLEDAVADDDA